METALFFHNNMTWKKPTKHAPVCSECICVCVSFCAQTPWITSVSYLMDGWWLHHLFCLQAGDGFDWTSRQHSGSIALSLCISSRKLSRWKRLIIGLTSGVMIVYWTCFPLGCLSFIFPLFSFVSGDPFCPFYFLSSRSSPPVTQLLMKFTFECSWPCYSLSYSAYPWRMFS